MIAKLLALALLPFVSGCVLVNIEDVNLLPEHMGASEAVKARLNAETEGIES